MGLFFLLNICVKYTLNQFTLYKTFSHLYLARVKSYCYYDNATEPTPAQHINVNVPIHVPLKEFSFLLFVFCCCCFFFVLFF